MSSQWCGLSRWLQVGSFQEQGLGIRALPKYGDSGPSLRTLSPSQPQKITEPLHMDP